VRVGALASERGTKGVDNQVFGFGECEGDTSTLVVSYSHNFKGASDGLTDGINLVSGCAIRVALKWSSSETINVAPKFNRLHIFEAVVAADLGDFASNGTLKLLSIQTTVLSANHCVGGDGGNRARGWLWKEEADL